MSPQEFEKSFSTISDRWKGKYIPAQVEEIYRALSSYDADDFARVCKTLCASSHRQPLIPDFTKALGELGARPKSSTAPRVSVDRTDHTYYWLRDNIWFNDTYVSIRATSLEARDNRFIIRAENPTHPLVIEVKSAPKDPFRQPPSKKIGSFAGLEKEYA